MVDSSSNSTWVVIQYDLAIAVDRNATPWLKTKE